MTRARSPKAVEMWPAWAWAFCEDGVIVVTSCAYGKPKTTHPFGEYVRVRITPLRPRKRARRKA